MVFDIEKQGASPGLSTGRGRLPLREDGCQQAEAAPQRSVSLPTSSQRTSPERSGGGPGGAEEASDDPAPHDASGDGKNVGAESAHALGLRERVKRFTPSWFSVTMGTGVLTTLLNLLPWPSIHAGLRYPAIAFLFVDIVIFLTFTAAFAARYAIWPQVLPLTIKHSQKSMFLGTWPMGALTIISGIATMGTREFALGDGFVLAASGLWWGAVLAGILVAVGIPFSMMTHQEHFIDGTTAALLLPVVPLITAAATGSVLAELLMDGGHSAYAFTILTVSYMVLGVGLPVACFILTLYFQRLLLFKAVPRDVIISVMLPLGPCGQGGEALLHLGQVAMALFPRLAEGDGDGSGVATLAGAGPALFGAGLGGALLLWGLGMWWLAIACATIVREVRKGALPFNLGWWSATFPLASLAIATVRLALVLDSLALKVAYTAMALAVLALWAIVFVPTVRGLVSGHLLVAPCLATLPLQ